jgi:hypothetical protein
MTIGCERRWQRRFGVAHALDAGHRRLVPVTGSPTVNQNSGVYSHAPSATRGQGACREREQAKGRAICIATLERAA